jgi:hypothetical protein
VKPSALLVPSQFGVSMPYSEMGLGLGASALLVDLYKQNGNWNNCHLFTFERDMWVYTKFTQRRAEFQSKKTFNGRNTSGSLARHNF